MPRIPAVTAREAGLLGRLAYRIARRRYGAVPEPLAVVLHHRPVFLAYAGWELGNERAMRRLPASLPSRPASRATTAGMRAMSIPPRSDPRDAGRREEDGAAVRDVTGKVSPWLSRLSVSSRSCGASMRREPESSTSGIWAVSWIGAPVPANSSCSNSRDTQGRLNGHCGQWRPQRRPRAVQPLRLPTRTARVATRRRWPVDCRYRRSGGSRSRGPSLPRWHGADPAGGRSGSG